MTSRNDKLSWVVAGIGDITTNRVIPAIEAEPRSAVYGVARYTYNELDQLLQVDHLDREVNSDGTIPSGAKVQTRSFVYDGYGRLTSQATRPNSRPTIMKTAAPVSAATGTQTNEFENSAFEISQALPASNRPDAA